MQRLTLILLYGGKSSEHEISLVSAASVLKQLDHNKYHIIPVAIDKAGCFYINDYQQLCAYQDALPVMTDSSTPLANLFIDGQLAINADIIFPILHGPLYEDGCIQGLFTLAGVAYVGCGVLSSAIGMDKDIARRLVCDETIRCAPYRTLSWFSSHSQRQQFCQKTAKELGWPLFVKPCSLGSSIGIQKVIDLEQFALAVEDAFRYDETILVEGYLAGREIELAVLENEQIDAPPYVSLAGEIKVNHQDGFYSYKAKYLESDHTQLIAPALLSTSLLTQLQTSAAKIFTRLKCQGLARVDFFVNSETNTIYFNEINTLPGFTSISMYPQLWQISGISYAELLDKLIMLGLTHHHCRQQLITQYHQR